jgi:hypothetical protein
MEMTRIDSIVQFTKGSKSVWSDPNIAVPLGVVVVDTANKKLRSLNLPDVLMICPRLVDKVVVQKTAINDFFSDFEKIVHPFIHLLFLTPRLFSIKLKNK